MPNDAEAGQEIPLVGWPAYPRQKLLYQAAAGRKATTLASRFSASERTWSAHNVSAVRFLSGVAVPIINGLQAGHRVVENTLGNLETDANFCQAGAERAAQIVQAHVGQSCVAAHALD